MVLQILLFAVLGSLGYASRARCPELNAGYIYANEETGSCFQFIIDPQVSWLDAHRICRSRGGRIATIDSQGVHNWVVNKLSGIGFTKNGFWTGLHDQHNEGGYIWDNYIDEGAAAVTWTNWNSGEPNDARVLWAQDCVYMRKPYGYKWVDVDCNGRFQRHYSYACEYEMVGDPILGAPQTPDVGTESRESGLVDGASFSKSASHKDKGVKASAIVLPLLFIAILLIIILVIYRRRRRRKHLEESLRLDNPCYRQGALGADTNNLSGDGYNCSTIQPDGNVRLQINPDRRATNMNMYEEDVAVFRGELALMNDGRKVSAENATNVNFERDIDERHVYADIPERGASHPGCSAQHDDIDPYEIPEVRTTKSCVSPSLPPRSDSGYVCNLEHEAPVKSVEKRSFRQNPLYEETSRNNPLYASHSRESLDDNLPNQTCLSNPVYDELCSSHYSEPNPRNFNLYDEPRSALYDEPRATHYDQPSVAHYNDPRPLITAPEYDLPRNVGASVSPARSHYDTPPSHATPRPDLYEATV